MLMLGCFSNNNYYYKMIYLILKILKYVVRNKHIFDFMMLLILTKTAN